MDLEKDVFREVKRLLVGVEIFDCAHVAVEVVVEALVYDSLAVVFLLYTSRFLKLEDGLGSREVLE